MPDRPFKKPFKPEKQKKQMGTPFFINLRSGNYIYFPKVPGLIKIQKKMPYFKKGSQKRLPFLTICQNNH